MADVIAVRCLRCHRKITDPISIARGVGETCLRKINNVKMVRRGRVVAADGQLDLFHHSTAEASSD